jgi:hypothetical protein
VFIGSVGCGRSREVTRLVGGARRSHGGGYLRLHDVAVVSASSSRGRAQVAPNARSGRGLLAPSGSSALRQGDESHVQRILLRPVI